MYKKIKNSSFMNLIWFLLATLPFVLLLIYAIGFFNNEDLRANEQDNYTLSLNSISGSTLKEEQNYALNKFSGYIGSLNTTCKKNLNIGTLNNNFGIQNLNNIYNDTNYLYFFTLYELNSMELEFAISDNNNNVYTNTSNTNYTLKNNYYEFNLHSIFNELETNNNVLEPNARTISFSSLNNNKENNYIVVIISKNQLFLNYNWFDNYIKYVNDFTTIKYNSCPISYSYNSNTYNIETNNNNYLGTNEQIEINQNFNYTLNEQPTLNYNNYFISQPIYETTTTTEIVNNLPNYINLHDTPNILNGINANIPQGDPQPNIKYYVVMSSFEYGEFEEQTGEQLTSENFEEYREDIRYFTRETAQQIITGYEYYNIESTINTSIELIPNNNFENFLTNVNNTIKSNGFISSAFLNLATIFGANNIYYSLACYYIEYLLVIILLHLAFDLLYIVPNICHKFMEKIGGERD